MFQTFPHTADLGLRVEAGDLNSLFADAAMGLFSIFVANLDDVRPTLTKNYHLTSKQHDFLLFDWLNELLFTFESEKLLFSKFDVQLDGFSLRAAAQGEPVDPQKHQLEHEVKAITYHGLKVEPTKTGYLAELIVDI